MENDERCAVARRERRDGLEDAVLGTGRLGRVARKEVVARLLGRELRDGREHAERVAGEHDDVLGLGRDMAGDLGVLDVLDRVRAARVLGNAGVVVVGDARDGVVHDVLEHGAEPDRVEDLRLLLRAEVDALCVAATLDVEDALVRPDVLVVADELPSGVCGEGRLARTGETEEEGDIAVLADVGRRMERELAELDGLEVVLE